MKSFLELLNTSPVDKSAPEVYTFEEILKFNPYHGPDGRFTGPGGFASFSANPDTAAGKKAIERADEKHRIIGAAFGDTRNAFQEAKDNIDIVRQRMSNDIKPIKAKSLDINEVMKDAGCDRDTAEKAGELAKGVFKKASADCPKITEDVVAVAAKNGGTMYGLGARQKMETSLARKIASDARDDGKTLEEAAANVKDSVRYTAIFETKDFKAGYESVKAELVSQGYKHIRSKDFFKDYEEGKQCIKSVQDVFESPNGTKFEFQFQTPQTQAAKEVTHPIYEAYRSASTTASDKARAWGIMTDIFADVPNY